MEVINVDTLIKLLEYLGCTVNKAVMQLVYDEDYVYIQEIGIEIIFPNGYVVAFKTLAGEEVESFLNAIKQCEEVVGKNIVKRSSTGKTLSVKIDWYPTD